MTRKSINDLLDIDNTELNSFNKSSLSKIVSRLASAANKRLKRFEDKGIESPATISASKGGKFRAKGKTLNQLRSEFMRVRNFLKMKTSTQKGYEKVKTDFFDRIEATQEQRLELSDEFLNKFWRFYDKTANLSPFIKGSPDRQKMVFDMMVKNPSLSEEELLKKLNDEFTVKYEEQQEIENEFDTSSFYSIS